MRRNAAISIALIALTACIFARALGNDFVNWDDDKNIYKNELITKGDALANAGKFWKGPFIGLYVPLTYTTWSLIAAASDTAVVPTIGPNPILSPRLFHGANLLIHLASTALVLLLVHELLGRKNLLAAALGAAIFAFHPLQVEPVVWATGMKDVLGSLLALICVLLYLRHSTALARDRKGRSLALYGGAFVFLLLALLAKPSLVVVPVILALIDFLILGSPWKKGLTGNLVVPVLGICGMVTIGWYLVVRKLWLPEESKYTLGFIAIVFTVFGAGVIALSAVHTSLFPPAPSVKRPFPAISPLAPAGPGVLAALFWILGPNTATSPVTAMIAISAVSLGLLGWKWKPLLDSPAVRLAPFFALAVTFTGITIVSQPEPDAVFQPAPTKLLQRPVVALDALAFYVSKTIYPIKLGIEYGRKPDVALDIARNYPVCLVPLIAAFLVLRTKNRRARYFAAFGIALAAILPVLGLVPFGFQGQSTVADRYVYLSMFGVGLAVASWVAFARSPWPRCIVMALMPVFGFLSFKQVAHWKNSESILTHALEVNPDSVSATYNLGLAYGDAGYLDKAIHWYGKAIKLKPEFPRPYNNLGFSLNETDRPREAIPYLEEAIRLDPDSGSSYSNLGISYTMLGDQHRAIQLFTKALSFKPDAPDFTINLAVAQMKLEDYDAALRNFAKASRIEPGWFQPYRGMGDIYMKTGRPDAAIGVFERLIQVKPGDPLNFKSLAMAYARVGRFPDAAAAAGQALRLARQVPGYPDSEIGNLERMAESFRKGILPEE